MQPFFLLLLMLILAACHSVGSLSNDETQTPFVQTDAVTYTVSQTIKLVNDGPQRPEKHNLWVGLIIDQAPYQTVLSREIQPANYTVAIDEYGNEYAEFDFSDLGPGESTQIKIAYQITVHELTFNLDQSRCLGNLPDEYNQPELHIESNNPQIVSLAKELTTRKQTICEQARSLYDYVSDNLVYTYNGNDWGAQAALGEMGADCTEYSSLLIALSRASGIPARYVEGLLYLDEPGSTEIRQEHAWTELYLPGNGWVPMDPTLGRSSLTRDHHFARYSPNHIIVTNGRHPSTLRGASYWSHLYWPGDSTIIRIQDAGWTIRKQNAS